MPTDRKPLDARAALLVAAGIALVNWAGRAR